jgi:F0F1-type ATP synthase assembly protein I
MKEREKKTKREKEPPNQFLKYTGIATQMGVVIAAGVFGGIYVDESFHFSTPWFTLLGSLLSIAIALYLTIKDLTK